MIYICSQCIEQQKLGPYTIKAQAAGVQFKQGLCLRHYVKAALDRGRSKKQIEIGIRANASTGFKPPVDLKKYPSLIKQYKQGIFKEPEV
jgi:hypothetical protein